MRITIFGVVWCIILIYMFIHTNPKYMIGITLFSMVFQASSVAFLNEEGIGPQVLTSVAMIVWNVIHSISKSSKIIKTQNRSVEEKISLVAIVLFIGVIVYSRSVNKNKYEITSIQYMMYFAQLMIYILCYLSCRNAARNLSEVELQTIIVRLIVFVVVLGGLQFLTTTNILPRNILWTTFIYNTQAKNIAYYVTEYNPRIFSTFMEPSYCAAFLVGAFYYVISIRPMNAKKIWLSVAVLIEIILTFSSSAYGAFAIVGVIYLIFSKNKRALKYLIPLAIIITVILIISGHLMNILNDVIFKKYESGSYIDRSGWDKRAIEAFHRSPIIGLGYYNVRGSSFAYSLLGQLGLLGAITWCFINVPLLVYGVRHRSAKNINCMFFHVTAITVMMIAVPDISYTVFWLSMYISAVSIVITQKIEISKNDNQM